MKLVDLKRKTANLDIFTKTALRAFEPKGDVLDANIKYWLKNGELVSIKKGWYAWRGRAQKYPAGEWLEYAAGKIVKPSYLSAEYVMAKYQLLSEPVQAITCVTVKSTREIKSKLGVWRYYSIAPRLFTGFTAKTVAGLPIFEAEKSKAVFDYLYFRFVKTFMVSESAVRELRINWENLSPLEFKQAISYARISKNKRLLKLFSIISRLYY